MTSSERERGQSDEPACEANNPAGCPRCGRLPAASSSGVRSIVFWPPAGHVRDHILRVARAREVELEPAGFNEALSWDAPEGEDVAGLVEDLRRDLSPVERRDVRVFLGRAGDFGVPHGREVGSLEDAYARLQSGWLLAVLQEDQLTSWLQPFFRAADGGLAGYEMLLRAMDAGHRPILPGPLFEVARGADLLFQLDLAARRSAIRTASRLGLDRLVFINFTPSAIYDPAFCLRATVRLVEEAGLAPEHVVFEITEADKEGDTGHLQDILRFYRSRGFRVALDDVGSGFASLQRLTELRPDIIKIDMGLVRNANGDPFRGTIARKLVETAQELRIDTVAEGIETEGERHFFTELGVTWLQGYLLGKPAPEPVA